MYILLSGDVPSYLIVPVTSVRRTQAWGHLKMLHDPSFGVNCWAPETMEPWDQWRSTSYNMMTAELLDMHQVRRLKWALQEKHVLWITVNTKIQVPISATLLRPTLQKHACEINFKDSKLVWMFVKSIWAPGMAAGQSRVFPTNCPKSPLCFGSFV